MDSILVQTLSAIEVGAPLVHRNLAAFPLAGPVLAEPDYLTLDEALARGVMVVSELTEAGSVPELKVVNQGDLAVLLLDGEELVGAKQNRVLNLTVLAPPKKTTVIPVSCVEAGRWASRSAAFEASPRAQYARGRARKLEQVSHALRDTGDARSDQGAVWDDISLKAERLGVSSGTSAMSDIFEHHGASVEPFVKALGPPAPGQSGVAFALDGRLVGCDLFDAASTCGRLLPKLVRSYAIDALEIVSPKAKRTPPPAPEAVRAFLDELAAAKSEAFRASGEGEAVRLAGPGVAGAALVARGRVVHLSAFRAAQSDGPRTSGRVRRRIILE